MLSGCAKQQPSSSSDLNQQLIQAVDHRDATLVCTLLDRGANAAAKNERGDSVLVYAARSGDAAIVKLLLMKISDTDVKKEALFQTTRGGPAMIEVDLATGQSIPKEKRSPWAETLGYLLDSGVPVDARDEENSTPLISAAAHGQTDMAEFLISRGADINATDKYGNSPLIAAACECAVANRSGR